VHDRTGEQVGRIIAEHGIVIAELRQVESSLEEVFFQLTGQETHPT
jgi:ABC-2 type transport system ATP-binding protein